MIEAVEVEGFRGLRRLKVEGLGRVNLIIGRNNSGKTALMEAFNIATDVGRTSNALITLQQFRRPGAPLTDFKRFWLPLFWNHDAERGFKIQAQAFGGALSSIEMRQVEARQDIVTKPLPRRAQRGTPWSIELSIEHKAQERKERIDSTSEGVKLPQSQQITDSIATWFFPHKDIGINEIRSFSYLKQSGSESRLLDVLREVDARVSGIELLSPTGEEAEIFVRLDADSPLLHIGMMGDGFQRCFELGVAAMDMESSTLLVDEFENGLHHSVLEPVWRWLAAISMTHGFQIFATTHSEECVQAACRAFTVAGDDGLRVTRLDRRAEETVATVYDRSLVEAAARMDIEIRG
jgi:hypothetical protein